MRDQAGRLRTFLRPGSAPEIAAEIAILLAAFPSPNAGESSAELRGTAYLYALSGFPRWAVAEAVRMWLTGENREEGDRHSFAPSPPQLVRLARLAVQPAEREIARLSRMAEAVVDVEPSRLAKPREPDGTVAWSQVGSSPVRSRREGEKREARREVVPLTDAELRAKLAASEPHPGKLEASPALVALLSQQRQEVA